MDGLHQSRRNTWETFPFVKKILFNPLIQEKNEQASLSSVRAQLERLIQGLLKTLMSFVITGGRGGVGEALRSSALMYSRLLGPSLRAGATQPGIAQDLKAINLHGEVSGKAPTVSTSCISPSPAAFSRTSRLPAAGTDGRFPLSGAHRANL